MTTTAGVSPMYKALTIANDIAKVRRIALNSILRDSKEASSLEALRVMIEARLEVLDSREQFITGN